METREVQVVNCDEEEEDWLPPPPKVLVDNQLGEDSAIKELRYMNEWFCFRDLRSNSPVFYIEERLLIFVSLCVLIEFVVLISSSMLSVFIINIPYLQVEEARVGFICKIS